MSAEVDCALRRFAGRSFIFARSLRPRQPQFRGGRVEVGQINRVSCQNDHETDCGSHKSLAIASRDSPRKYAVAFKLADYAQSYAFSTSNSPQAIATPVPPPDTESWPRQQQPTTAAERGTSFSILPRLAASMAPPQHLQGQCARAMPRPPARGSGGEQRWPRRSAMMSNNSLDLVMILSDDWFDPDGGLTDAMRADATETPVSTSGSSCNHSASDDKFRPSFGWGSSAHLRTWHTWIPPQSLLPHIPMGIEDYLGQEDAGQPKQQQLQAVEVLEDSATLEAAPSTDEGRPTGTGEHNQDKDSAVVSTTGAEVVLPTGEPAEANIGALPSASSEESAQSTGTEEVAEDSPSEEPLRQASARLDHNGNGQSQTTSLLSQQAKRSIACLLGRLVAGPSVQPDSSEGHVAARRPTESVILDVAEELLTNVLESVIDMLVPAPPAPPLFTSLRQCALFSFCTDPMLEAGAVEADRDPKVARFLRHLLNRVDAEEEDLRTPN